MDKIKTITFQKSIHLALISLFLISLPFSIKFNSLLVILLAVNSLFYLKINFKNDDYCPRRKKLLFLFASFFFIYLISLLFVQDLKHSWFSVEKKLSLLAFPVIFGCTPKLKLKQKEIYFLLLLFVSAVFISVLWSFREGVEPFLKSEKGLVNVVGLLLIHRPYFGLYTIFCSFILFDIIIRKNSFLVRIIGAIAIGIFVIFSYLILAKMAIIAGLLTLGLILILYTFSKRKYFYLVFIALIGFGSIYYLVNYNEKANRIIKRAMTEQNLSTKEYDFNYVNSFNERLVIWECSFDILKKDNNWITGFGIADVQPVLDNCYNDRHFINWMKGKNAHNQYLHTWLDLGIVGLLLFMVTLIFPFTYAIKDQNYLWMAFLLLFSICCLTESMLSVQKGVVFYAFFNSFFALGSTINNNKKSVVDI